MGTKRTSGVVAGLILFGAAGWAAEVRPWNKADVQQANELFASRSGFEFGVTDADRQALHVHVVAIPDLRQVINVATVGRPGTVAAPPDPCFNARVAPIDANGGGGEVTLRVLRPDAFSIEGPAGGTLHVCSATVPVNGVALSDTDDTDTTDTTDAATAPPAGLWTAAGVRQANALFSDRSGIHFSVHQIPPDPVFPPDPIRQALHLHAVAASELEQNIVVATPGINGSPPDPCFNAKIAPASLGGAITVHVARLGSFAIEGPSGEALDLCRANGEHVSN
jgi:hypothetical protein